MIDDLYNTPQHTSVAVKQQSVPFIHASVLIKQHQLLFIQPNISIIQPVVRFQLCSKQIIHRLILPFQACMKEFSPCLIRMEAV